MAGLELYRTAAVGLFVTALSTAPAAAQSPIGLGSLPPAIAAAIRAAPLTQSLIPISGDEAFSQQIIKADEISFSPNSKLTLTNLNVPWVVVAARRIKFEDPSSYSVIQRDPGVLQAQRGADGPQGPRGPDRPGETGRRGNDGGPGGVGGNGLTGGTKQLPKLYIVVGQLLDTKGPIPPGLLNLVVFLRGIDGGDGGTGGRGGDGGNAGNGKEGATHALDCGEGGGPGGNGGAAGPGGRGGDAGGGGNGGDLVLVTTKPTYEVLSFLRINDVGGLGGTPGHGGAAGAPGKGGRGANSNGWCKATDPGHPGGYPSPINQGDGSTAGAGTKGTVTAAILPSVDDLFP